MTFIDLKTFETSKLFESLPYLFAFIALIFLYLLR